MSNAFVVAAVACKQLQQPIQSTFVLLARQLLNRQLIRGFIILRILRNAGFQIGHIRQICRLAQERQLRLCTRQFGFVFVAFNRVQYRLGFGQFVTLGQAAAIQNQRLGVGIVFSQDTF